MSAPGAADGPSPLRVAAFVPDLLDQARLRAAFADVVFVRRAADLLSADAERYVVDLDRPGVLAALADLVDELPAGCLVGFGAHVDGDRLAEARAAGVEALARSVFFRRIPGI